MRNVESKAPVEKQHHETPDDWSIPDFLRRTAPLAVASPANTSRDQAVAT